MPGWQEWVQLTTTAGSPVQVGATTVTPLAQALVVRFPWQTGRTGATGAFVWNRPVAVMVEREGQVRRLPVVDITRIAVWSLVAGTLLATTVLAFARRNKER